MKIYFLHISDIHCGYDNYMVSNMRELLPTEINDFIVSKGQNVLYLFVTGDLKYGKFNPDKYPPSTLKFINNIQKIIGIEPRNTFIVPGNHDVKRGFIRSSAIARIKSNYSSNQGKIEDECIEALFQTKQEFKIIYKDICGREYKNDIFYMDMGDVNIIHLNTALICGEDNEDGTLIIGMQLLKNALMNMDTTKPAIALGHHSFDCLTTSEQIELERFLKSKNTILYLCGHKHVTLCSNISVVEKCKPLWQFLCGTNMDQDPNLVTTDMDVFVGMLDTENCSGYFDAYKWSSKSGHWMPDSDFSYMESKTTDGRVYYPSKESCLSTEAIKRYLQYLKLSCSDIRLDGLPVDGYVGSKNIPLDVLYVPIRFDYRFNTKQEELEAIEAMFDEEHGSSEESDKSPKKSINYVSPIQNYTYNSIILAGPGHGKTTFIKKVINYYGLSDCKNNADKFPDIKQFPIWIKCRSLNAYNDFSIMGIIKKLPFAAEFPPNNKDLEEAFFDTIYKKLLNGEIILLIDGLDEISDPFKRISFIEQIDVFSKQYPQNRIIISSRIAGYEDYNKSCLADFKKFHIQPFDDYDIKELCVKWHKAAINSLDETIRRAYELAHIIITNDRIKNLAENPLLLTTLLLVQRRVGRLPTRRVALYEESIKVLLETWNQEGHEPMDYAETLCQLAYVAFSMTTTGIQQIKKNELISILYQAKEDLSRKLKYNQG